MLECIPSDIAKEVTEKLKIPTIGIGAGPGCDGQVLVINDMIGLTDGYVPSFVKAYANLKETIQNAAGKWCDEVRASEFPGEDHSF